MPHARNEAPLPPAFSAVAAMLARVAPPGLRATADGAWGATYRVGAVHREPLAAWVCSPVGGLRIERGPDEAGRFSIGVALSLAFPAGQQDRCRAALRCRSDGAGSLLGWERASQFARTADQGPSPSPVRTDRGEVASGRVERDPGPPLRARPPIVANWVLFDRIGRLREPLGFTLLDELDALRADQRLRPYRDAVVAMSGGDVRLTGWLQTGRGVLPTTWWVHETGIPLMVLAGLRAYTFDPTVKVEEVSG